MASLRESDTSELMRSWVGLSTEEVAMNLRLPVSTVNRHLAEVNRALIARSQARASKGFVDPTGASSAIETAIMQLGARLATEVTAQTPEEYRVHYLRVSGETVVPVSAGSEPSWDPKRRFRLSEHPFVKEMVATGQPLAGVLQTKRLGRNVRALAAQMGIVAGGGVPIKLKGSVHGILSLSTRGVPPSHDLLQHLAAVARIVELALVNHH